MVYSSDIARAIDAAHPWPRWAVAHEVRDAAGFEARRSADAIALSLWPSHGLHVHGYEIKVSASDLRKELNDPRKAEQIAKYCDFWWLAIDKSTANSVVMDDVPGSWGVKVFDGKRLRVERKAERFGAPKPLDRSFVVSMVRSQLEHCSTKMVYRSEIQSIIDDAVEAAKVRAEATGELEMKGLRKQLAEAMGWIDKLHQETGINLREDGIAFDRANFWETVKAGYALAKDGAIESRRKRLEHFADDLDAAAAVLRQVVARSNEVAEAVA